MFSIETFDRYWSLKSRGPIILFGFLGTVLLAAIDFLTGFELSFAVFYLGPISFVSWYVGRRDGYLTSVVSIVAWEEANRLSGLSFSHPAILFWNAATRFIFFVITVHLLVLLKQALNREQALSRTDPLTGVSNLRGFQEKVTHEIDRARRYGLPITLVYLDLDNFKQVNDTLGHAKGDELLRTVAQIFKGNIRQTDVIARLGGDEFGLLLLEMNGNSAALFVNKIHSILQKEIEISRWPITFSISVLSCVERLIPYDEMLKCLDEALYEIKNQGKNAVRHIVI